MMKKNNFDITKSFKKGIEVSADEVGGDFNRMLKKFSKKFTKSDVIKDVYDRMYFESKSQIRRRKKKKATRVAKLKQNNDQK